MKQLNHKTMSGAEYIARKLNATDIRVALEKANPGFVCGKANLPDKILMYNRAAIVAPVVAKVDPRPVRGSWTPAAGDQVVCCQVSGLLPWRQDLQVGVRYRVTGIAKDGICSLLEYDSITEARAVASELMPLTGYFGEFVPDPVAFRPAVKKPAPLKKGDKVIIVKLTAPVGRSKARLPSVVYTGNTGTLRGPVRGTSTAAFWVALEGDTPGHVCMVHPDEVRKVWL